MCDHPTESYEDVLSYDSISAKRLSPCMKSLKWKLQRATSLWYCFKRFRPWMTKTCDHSIERYEGNLSWELLSRCYCSKHVSPWRNSWMCDWYKLKLQRPTLKSYCLKFFEPVSEILNGVCNQKKEKVYRSTFLWYCFKVWHREWIPKCVTIQLKATKAYGTVSNFWVRGWNPKCVTIPRKDTKAHYPVVLRMKATKAYVRCYGTSISKFIVLT